MLLKEREREREREKKVKKIVKKKVRYCAGNEPNHPPPSLRP